jgi:hypothetical protein
VGNTYALHVFILLLVSQWVWVTLQTLGPGKTSSRYNTLHSILVMSTCSQAPSHIYKMPCIFSLALSRLAHLLTNGHLSLKIPWRAQVPHHHQKPDPLFEFSFELIELFHQSPMINVRKTTKPNSGVKIDFLCTGIQWITKLYWFLYYFKTIPPSYAHCTFLSSTSQPTDTRLRECNMVFLTPITFLSLASSQCYSLNNFMKSKSDHSVLSFPP